MEEKITIIDVARKAGVSKGTVDRVLHNRGEVSAKSAEKVRKAIEEMNYHPNLYASLLASKKAKIIACLMPNTGDGEFWDKLYKGIMQGGEEVGSLNIKIHSYMYDQYDLQDFTDACARVLKDKPDGVVMPVLYQQATAEFAGKLYDAEIPYVYIDTKVEDDENKLAFVGMPRRDSGIMCAALLADGVPGDFADDILVVHIRRDVAGISDPTQKRREGFMSFMNENYPAAKIHNVYIKPSDAKAIRKELSAYFAEHPDTRFVAMFNSRLHLIAGALEEHPCEGRRVIGFDDIPGNLEMLRKNLAHFIIAQHIEFQAAKAVHILADHILSQKKPADADIYFHIDILTKYNLENY